MTTNQPKNSLPPPQPSPETGKTVKLNRLQQFFKDLKDVQELRRKREDKVKLLLEEQRNESRNYEDDKIQLQEIRMKHAPDRAPLHQQKFAKAEKPVEADKKRIAVDRARIPFTRDW